MYYFTSDTHFGHGNIIKYSNRPFNSLHEMNTTLTNNWNSIVSPKDIVWHLGDVAFGSIKYIENILSKLNGQINIVLGNHDKTLRRKGSSLVEKGIVNSIQDYKELSLNNNKIILFHYSCRVWNKSHFGSIMLYGHSHGSLPPLGKSVDVGVDSKEISEEYRPYSLAEILNYFKEKTNE